MDKGADRQLATLVTGARIGCGIRTAFGAALMAAGFAYEGFVTMAFATPNLFVIALGLGPVAVGLYVVVRTWLRLRVLGQVLRRPDRVQLAELAMRWGQPALRVTLGDGASESFSTGKADRNLLIDAIRRRALANELPRARVVDS